MTPERWQQIEALFHAARARPAGERLAFLATACPTDESLRREVEQLLSQPGSDEGLLAGSVGSMAAALTATAATLTGRTLGGYHVLALIGVGGMGEVYRARDSKLGREVAIKVLPRAFTSDPARLARFEREARTLAALNHPNICAIHGLEEAEPSTGSGQEAVRFLILELVDGDTLADRLVASRRRADGPGLPQREALNVARQIARALDFAHERGIVHRDLKPANIKITTDGTVKVLDFGLAKAVTGDSAGADVGPLAQAQVDGTIEGAIIGTPAYMSPEQARGRPVDKRTDIWAFGCVLHEMLTGRATFSGDTAADTIARILEREPDWSALPSTTPEPIRTLLLGCLAKDSRERLRDIGDVRIAIDSILSGSSSGTYAAAARQEPRPRTAWLPWAVVAALALILAATAVWNLRPPPPPTISHLTITIPTNQVLDGSGGAHILAVSREGTEVAYVASRQLYRRPIDKRDAEPIPGSDLYPGAREPVYSPTGKEIAFFAFAEQQLMRIPAAGGVAVKICDAEAPFGMSWSKNDIILFGQGGRGIYRVAASGGPCQSIASVSEGEQAHGPQLLPDGDRFLFTIATGRRRDRWDNARVVIRSLSKPKFEKRIAITGSDARYVEPGYLLYAVSGHVYGIRFDPDRGEVSGAPVLVQDEVSRAAGAVTGAANFAVSDNGTIVYVPGPASAAPVKMAISLADPVTTKVTTLSIPAAAYDSLRVSPNDRRIAFGKESDNESTVYTYDIREDTGTDQPLPTHGNSRYPTWSPDSKSLAFQSDHDGRPSIWVQSADGGGKASILVEAADGESLIPESWHRDTLLYSSTRRGRASLWTVTVHGGQVSDKRPFGTSLSTDPMSAVFSRDGRTVAFTWTERTIPNICVQPFPQGERLCHDRKPADTPKHQRWSFDGKRLYFNPRIGFFESVNVMTGPLRFRDVKNETFHPFQLAPPGTRTPYDVMKDGRFVGLTTPGENGYRRQLNNEIFVILNWFEVLKEKVRR